MKFSQIIKAAMKETNRTQEMLGNDLGMKQNAVSNMLNRKEPSLATFREAMEVMGYEIVVQKKTQGRRKEGQMVLTAEETMEE